MEAPLTVREVANRLKVNEETVRRYLRSGKLIGKRLYGLGEWRVEQSEINRFLREGQAKKGEG
jgi:excisionase family DNA binding protein